MFPRKVLIGLSILLFCATVCFALEQDRIVKEAIHSLEEPYSPGDQENDPKAPAGILLDMISFQNMDIMEALRVLEQKSGLTFLPSKNIEGIISLNLNNIVLEDALRIILQPEGFAFYKKNGIVEIMSIQDFLMEYGYEFDGNIETSIISIKHADPEDCIVKIKALKSDRGRIYSDRLSKKIIILDGRSQVGEIEELMERIDVPLETRAFPLRYVRVENIKEKVKEMLTEGVGHIEDDILSNTVTVTDTIGKIEEIMSFIKRRDRKIEVSIEAGVIQVRLKEEHRQGVDWEAIVSDYQKLDLYAKDDNVFPRRKRLSIGTITDEDYIVLLDALDTVGEMKTLLNFKTTAVVNFDKKINLDTGMPLKGISSASGPESLVKDSFDIRMDMTPRLDEEGDVVMRLSPKLYWSFANEISSRKDITESYICQVPIDVTVEANETIVIGGLVREQEVSRIAKLPLFGDLPIVGFVFRHKSRLVQRIEYVIFLTPRIIRENGDDRR